MISEIKKIHNFFQNEQFFITNHARVRMFERNISTTVIMEIVLKGEIIKEYLDDKPCPSFLILGFLKSKPYHIVIAECEDHARVITIYEPDAGKWTGFRKRKE